MNIEAVVGTPYGLITCVVCYKPSTVLYKGTSYCRSHFENVWTYETGKKVKGDEKNWGKSLEEMKNDKT